MINAYVDSNPPIIPGTAVYGLIRMSEPARAMAIARDRPTSNDAAFMALLWSPCAHAVRTSPGFPDFARKLGFTDVWDKYGPPDDCRRVAPGEYACK
jgi:hypothetical protein